LLKTYLADHQIEAEIVSMQGAVELAPRTNMAEAICDLVSTGSTLASNGLKEVEIMLESQAVLVKNASLSPSDQDIFDRLLSRLKAVLRAENSRYIMLHCAADRLEAIKSVLPGSESPTVLPLQGEKDRVAVHAVCDEEIFWNTMEELKASGASAILVLPIEKMLD
jgi:ATP phosphoribosyltransferase